MGMQRYESGRELFLPMTFEQTLGVDDQQTVVSQTDDSTLLSAVVKTS